MSYSGNKGEWSEIYTLLKLAGEKRVFAGDANLDKIDNLFYPILKIIRSEKDETFFYTLDSKIIIKNSSDEIIDSFSFKEFSEKALELLHKIKSLGRNKSSIPEFDSFLRSIQCLNLSAKSSEKRDLTLIVHDPITQHEPKLGFSIKSRLGAPATLINSTIGTNFEFEILDSLLSNEIINQINNDNKPTKGKIQRRFQSILDNGGRLRFHQIIEKTFSQNLKVIDSNLPLIISECLKLYYSGTARKIPEIVDHLNTINPCEYDLTDEHPFYKYKLKRLLYDSALGMVKQPF